MQHILTILNEVVEVLSQDGHFCVQLLVLFLERYVRSILFFDLMVKAVDAFNKLVDDTFLVVDCFHLNLVYVVPYHDRDTLNLLLPVEPGSVVEPAEHLLCRYPMRVVGGLPRGRGTLLNGGSRLRGLASGRSDGHLLEGGSSEVSADLRSSFHGSTGVPSGLVLVCAPQLKVMKSALLVFFKAGDVLSSTLAVLEVQVFGLDLRKLSLDGLVGNLLGSVVVLLGLAPDVLDFLHRVLEFEAGTYVRT